MVKPSKENEDIQQQQNLDPENPESSRSSSLSRSCSSALSRLFSLRCLIVIVLSFVILLSVIFLLFIRRSPSDDTVKVTDSIQAYFRLHKPASKVISHKGRLEHEIFQSIGRPNTNVTILSLKQSGSHHHHYTDVKFAVRPNSNDHAITNDSLSSLRSSFVKLFTERSTLKLTKTSFGKATSFQVLKFPLGITIDPLPFNPSSRIVEILFRFSLQKSLSDLQDCFAELTNQVGQTLCSKPHESIHLIFKNEKGSTISPPVTVHVALVSTRRKHHHKRLDRFAQIIQTSKNLGLDSSVFGEVKNITFSTDLDKEIIDHASVLALAPPT